MQTKTVLIVEDTDDIGKALKLLVEYEGYVAILSDRAIAGRELARKHRPDLIIVDLRLPDEDGIELTRQLRSDPETVQTPIICVSSYIKGIEAEAILAGCNEVFSKTTFMECFHETLRKYLADE